jgi:hypothetical protein
VQRLPVYLLEVARHTDLLCRWVKEIESYGTVRIHHRRFYTGTLPQSLLSETACRHHTAADKKKQTFAESVSLDEPCYHVRGNLRLAKTAVNVHCFLHTEIIFNAGILLKICSIYMLFMPANCPSIKYQLQI